ncbi:competence protein ComK [Bacillus sp. MUM 13]|uniref:competence protein ComK n=1 Tax=Bacillus sp. MUM 13 TaxID=1678001 RepID=UPI001F0AA386|nr:competence protein ComK [Bacillus sp. MUM 13]
MMRKKILGRKRFMTDFKPSHIEEYEISPFTLLIMPINYGSKIYSHIIEVEDEFISPFKPIDIIKKSCEYFGSSYEGRKDGTKELIGITHKAPIAIDPTSSVFFFPTTSPMRPKCIWLSHSHVSRYNRKDSTHTKVVFRSKQNIEVPVSSSSFGNQVLRTAQLKAKLTQRIEESERKSYYLFTGSGNSEASEFSSAYTPGNRKR